MKLLLSEKNTTSSTEFVADDSELSNEFSNLF